MYNEVLVAHKKRYFSKKFYNLKCITCMVNITDFEKERRGKDRRQHHKTNILWFLCLVSYIKEGYKSRRGENVYLARWQLQDNIIVLFIEAPCCQHWLHYSLQTPTLKDILLVILKLFWLTLASVLHFTEQSPIHIPCGSYANSPSHITGYLACFDPSRKILVLFFLVWGGKR